MQITWGLGWGLANKKGPCLHLQVGWCGACGGLVCAPPTEVLGCFSLQTVGNGYLAALWEALKHLPVNGLGK